MFANTSRPTSEHRREASRIVSQATHGFDAGGVIGGAALDAVASQKAEGLDVGSRAQRQRNESAIARIMAEGVGDRIARGGIAARIVVDAAIQRHAAETTSMYDSIRSGRSFDSPTVYPREAVLRVTGRFLPAMSMKLTEIEDVRRIGKGRFDLIGQDAPLATRLSESLSKAEQAGPDRAPARVEGADRRSGLSDIADRMRGLLKGGRREESGAAVVHARAVRAQMSR